MKKVDNQSASLLFVIIKQLTILCKFYDGHVEWRDLPIALDHTMPYCGGWWYMKKLQSVAADEEVPLF